MYQSPQTTPQTVADLAQRISASELTEQHGDELRPAGKALGSMLGGVLLYQCGKLRPREVLEQLIEQARDLYDRIALLWAACGEAPTKERLANVNYRRALSSISDCKYLFWTRVDSFWELFAYAFGVLFIFNLVDLLILDWLIVCWLKPRRVILPGTEHVAIPNPYLHHFKEFLMGTAGLGIVGLAIAALLTLKSSLR
jgi:hypothetical protein